MIKYFHFLYKKMKQYDKKATNPFINRYSSYNPDKTIYKQTYIWVEKRLNTD